MFRFIFCGGDSGLRFFFGLLVWCQMKNDLTLNLIIQYNGFSNFLLTGYPIRISFLCYFMFHNMESHKHSIYKL